MTFLEYLKCFENFLIPLVRTTKKKKKHIAKLHQVFCEFSLVTTRCVLCIYIFSMPSAGKCLIF